MRRRTACALLLFLLLLEQQLHLQTIKTEVDSQRLPAEFDGFRIVQLSDLHGRQFGKGNRYLLKKVAALEPDLIAVTGDMVSGDEDTDAAAVLLGALAELAPTFFVTGNHEWSLSDLSGVLSDFEAAGAMVLQNRGVLLKKEGAEILIGGVDDPCGPCDMPVPEIVGQRLRQGTDSFFLLLAHRNDSPAVWEKTGADLVLAGHGHGGIIRLPFLGGMVQRGQQESGLSRSGATQLYVSRGLGGKGLRLNNRPEVSLLVLRKS